MPAARAGFHRPAGRQRAERRRGGCRQRDQERPAAVRERHIERLRVIDRIEIALGQECQVPAIEREHRAGVGEPAVRDVDDPGHSGARLAVGGAREGRGPGWDQASQAASGDQESPSQGPSSPAATSVTVPDATSTTRTCPSCAATATREPSGDAAIPVTPCASPRNW